MATPQSHGNKSWVDIMHSPLAAWLILLTSLLITIAAWRISNQYAEEKIADRFLFYTQDARIAIEKRMHDYEQVLRSGVALFNSSTHVSREEWKQFAQTLDLDHQYPGIQGFGFSQWIKPEQLDAHTKALQNEGFPDYQVKPPGAREQYSSIIYLEPFSGRNLRAFGFDMYSETTRREAMSRARDSGAPALSGRVTLLQETNKDVQPGFLMYLPVYKGSPTTLEERQNSLLGFVYSPFRIRDLMHGILASGSPEIFFEIYDDNSIDESKLLYRADGQPDSANSQLKQIITLSIAGRPWTVVFAPTPSFTANNTTSQPLVIAAGGIIIDVLLFAIILVQTKQRRLAQRLAVQMSEQLDEKEHHFKAIADTANDAIVSANEKGVITYFNRAAEDIFGYTQEEILHQPITLLMPNEYQANHQTRLEHAVNTGKHALIGKRLDLIGQRKNGEQFPIEISISHWAVADKHYFNATIRDITERKRIDKMKSEFISTVSHELRTPLTSISGSLGLVINGTCGELTKQAQDMLRLALRNIERLNRLINDILDIEKIEAGAIHLNRQYRELAPLIHIALDSQANAARLTNVDLIPGAIDNVYIYVDEDRFLQILFNLINNAIKFSPSGGVVCVTTQVEDDMVRISIIDDGNGIPEEFKARIFSKFAQADGSDTRQKGGTGLGLSITKALVEAHSGRIGYESQKGAGTTFYFLLPIAQRPAIESPGGETRHKASA